MRACNFFYYPFRKNSYFFKKNTQLFYKSQKILPNIEILSKTNSLEKYQTPISTTFVVIWSTNIFTTDYTHFYSKFDDENDITIKKVYTLFLNIFDLLQHNKYKTNIGKANFLHIANAQNFKSNQIHSLLKVCRNFTTEV